MHAFRDAFHAKDARKREEQRVGGERVISKRSALARRGADEATLKHDLVVDLLALINTVDLGSVVELEDLEYVYRSVLNYGLPDLGRLTSEEFEVDEIAENLRSALIQHEPRLVPESLRIDRDEEFDDVNQRIRFNVSAAMFYQPADLPIEFVAEIDIGSGKILLSRLPVAP